MHDRGQAAREQLACVPITLRKLRGGAVKPAARQGCAASAKFRRVAWAWVPTQAWRAIDTASVCDTLRADVILMNRVESLFNCEVPQ
ncbi:hypothetical protein GCM10027093_03430 [Paraburkholderia jirisanensis]